MNTVYIQIPNRHALEELRHYLLSNHLSATNGLFGRSYKDINFPTYYAMTSDFKAYVGWQSSKLTTGTWVGSSYEQNYLTGISVRALTHPQEYPEYHI